MLWYLFPIRKFISGLLVNFEKKGTLQYDRENITEVIQCKFFTNFFDKGILIFMTLYFHEKISLTLILLIVHSNYISINFIWIFRENAAAMLHISTAFWVTLKYEMQERSRTFCLFLESLLKFRPTFYDQFTFETAIAIVNIPNYKYHHCYYPRSKLYIVSM